MSRATDWAAEGGWSFWVLLAAAFLCATAWIGLACAPVSPEPAAPSTVAPWTPATDSRPVQVSIP